MNIELLKSFALLFGATIALICAVYVALGMRRKRNQIQPQEPITTQ